ncbi:hypothetical protein E2C01_047924 [Portunus trituberculatus]|uniref:Uncharacterized protein n=1 Tax=Portunus trituberculatus TaxID=210409 RepID=A0A5B7GA62_PORTR|nr:hypothetical protein [Portunus trituberculatus]
MCPSTEGVLHCYSGYYHHQGYCCHIYTYLSMKNNLTKLNIHWSNLTN